MRNEMIVKITIILAIFHDISHILCDIKLRSVEDEHSDSVHIANNINQFGTDFYKVISKDKSRANMVCSTVSAAMVLMMAAYGAGGETLAEMNKVLHIRTHNTLVHVSEQKDSIHSLIDHFNSIKQVRLATNIYIKSNLRVKPDFETITDTVFRSGIKSLNFSDSEVASQEINTWCEQQTDSRIKNIVQPDDFDDTTVLVLVNAVYFKGNWARKFNENDTKFRTFYRHDNTSKQVPMMHDLGKYRYGELSQLSARFLELPYKTDVSMSMIIILPNKINGLRIVEENLHKVNLTQLLIGNEYEVDLFMPKFKIESKIDLKTTLSALGMVEIFGNRANFTGITDQSPLRVSKILQKAFIEVSEEGSEVAAITASELENRIGHDDVIEHVSFHVNRPFLSLIAFDNVVLFTAHVVDI